MAVEKKDSSGARTAGSRGAHGSALAWMFRRLHRHEKCVCLYLKKTKAGYELRCWDRTHGGRHVLVWEMPNEKLRHGGE